MDKALNFKDQLLREASRESFAVKEESEPASIKSESSIVEFKTPQSDEVQSER